MKRLPILTPAQAKAIQDYLDDSRKLLEAVACVISGRLTADKRVTSTEVAQALKSFMGLRRWGDEDMIWRTRVIISTAFHAGAFKAHDFELRPGVGFRLKAKTMARVSKIRDAKKKPYVREVGKAA